MVRLPALRERSDFEVVTLKILHSLCAPGQQVSLSPEVMRLFQNYRWPGNLLRTAVVMVGGSGAIGTEHLPDDFLDEVREHMAHMAPPDPVPCEEAALGLPVTDPLSPCADGLVAAMPTPAVDLRAMTSTPMAPAAATSPPPARLQDVALQAMTDALRQCQGNVSAAAKLLGVSRNTIYRKKEKLPPDVRL